jgi:DNA-binding MarR family transcriptional regulator
METFIRYWLTWKLNICFEAWPKMKKDKQEAANRDEKNPMTPENEAQLVQLLLKCGLFLQREMNQVFRRFDLKQQQFSVLDEIVRHGPISQKELGEALLFEKSNISKIVRILLGKNLIKVTVAPMDRRLTLLSDTTEGISLWQDCMRAFNESSTDFLSLLSEDELTKTIELLQKLQRSFENK